MRIKYNAPTVLTFTLICTAIMILSQTLVPNLITDWFLVPGKNTFSLTNFRHWIGLLTHVMGHANWPHLINNFTLILLIGPMLEEIYGSKELLIMIVITSLVTGILNAIIFRSALMGASGVVFMMILLSSFTNFSHGEIPLTFIIVLLLYMGVQLFQSFSNDNISQFAHVIGGLCGSFFGFSRPDKRGNE